MNPLQSFIAGSLTTSFIIWWAVCTKDYIVNPLIQCLVADMIVLGLVLISLTKDKKKVKRK
jgi:hypothetical protein